MARLAESYQATAGGLEETPVPYLAAGIPPR